MNLPAPTAVVHSWRSCMSVRGCLRAFPGAFSRAFSRLPLVALALIAFVGPAIGEEKLHEVTAESGKATAGAKGKVSVTLAAKNGWKLNEEAPMSVKLAPSA